MLRMPMPFVPASDSAAVQKLRDALDTDEVAVRVKVITQSEAKQLDCFTNVQNTIRRDGYGKMLLGWAVWQHSHLFIEAERHAVLDPRNGQPWVDCTPHRMPDGQWCNQILFIPDKDGSYDFSTTNLVDNMRVPLVDDPRVLEALRLFSQKVALMNSVPEINIELPQNIARRVLQVQTRASMLLSEAMEPQPARFAKVGRNDPCPCGNGKKYKKCHGANL